MYSLYRTVSSVISPAVPMLLRSRLARGKEDAARLPERLGVASIPRPEGKLLWIHAASVGESNAVLPLMEELLKQHANLHILLTTVTVTSAALMAQRLPMRAIHQFAPVDTPASVQAFLRHWRPDIALWVDSEFWPNLLHETKASGAAMGIINARMSERSFARWQRLPSFIRDMLSGFTLCFAQSREDAKRLEALGLKAEPHIGNLKYDVPALPCDEAELARLREAVDNRPLWLAASTHPGEEKAVADIHQALGIPNLLTIIVPRHSRRGEEIARELAAFSLARRAANQAITPKTQIYLADTMGELGLFYRLAPLTFIGGTLVAHGGQNPLEPARLGCAILAGPHMENFAAIAAAMENEGALIRVTSKETLAGKLKKLLSDSAARETLGKKAQAHLHTRQGTLLAITQQLQPLLA